MSVRALYAGVPFDELDDTTLVEIDLRYRAKELEHARHAKALLELKLSDMSAESLGESEEKASEAKPEEQTKRERHIARGNEIKAEIREALSFQFMSDLEQAVYVARYGLPGQPEAVKSVEPLRGVSETTARTIVALLSELRFTYGAWAHSRFRAQLNEGDARARLERLAEGDEG